MRIESQKLLQDLIIRTQKNSIQAIKLSTLSIEILNWRAAPASWSILECLQHLNLYGSFYIPEIESKINQTNTTHKKTFKSGLLGNYFANSLLPKDKLNAMKTFKDKNPIGSKLDAATVLKFVSQQEQLLILLHKSRKVDISKIRTPISISKWITLKLGDTFRVVIYHNERHIAQANKTLKYYEKIIF